MSQVAKNTDNGYLNAVPENVLVLIDGRRQKEELKIGGGEWEAMFGLVGLGNNSVKGKGKSFLVINFSFYRDQTNEMP